MFQSPPSSPAVGKQVIPEAAVIQKCPRRLIGASRAARRGSTRPSLLGRPKFKTLFVALIWGCRSRRSAKRRIITILTSITSTTTCITAKFSSNTALNASCRRRGGNRRLMSCQCRRGPRAQKYRSAAREESTRQGQRWQRLSVKFRPDVPPGSRAMCSY